MAALSGRSASPSATAPIEVFLPDGTHVVLEVANETVATVQVEEAVMGIVLSAPETEGEFRRTVERQVSELGLSASVSGHHHERRIVVGDGED
jgi:hypothetical protein